MRAALLNLVAFASLLLPAVDVSAVGIVLPPAGDNPTPPGYLLVKLVNGVDDVRVRVGPAIAPAFIPQLKVDRDITLNWAGQQLWTQTGLPQFVLRHQDMPGWPSSHSDSAHNLLPEVQAGLTQVTLHIGAFTPNPLLPSRVLPQYPGSRQFTYEAGAYSRSVTLPVGNVVPEPGSAFLCAAACLILRFAKNAIR